MHGYEAWHYIHEAPLTLRRQRSCCRNIEGERQIFGSLTSLTPRPLLPLNVILWWALGNPSRIQNLKSLVSAVAQILKGNPKMLVSSPSPGPRPLFLWCVIFMTGLGKTQSLTNFEVASCSHYRNINREPQIFGSFPSPKPRQRFALGVILWWSLANLSCKQNLKSLASAVAEVLEKNPKKWGAHLAQVHAHFFSECDFVMGLGKPQLVHACNHNWQHIFKTTYHFRHNGTLLGSIL